MLIGAYSTFIILHFEPRNSNLNLRRSTRAQLPHEEANEVWWPPRSSKPLFRRGSVEGLVRFRRASAICYTNDMTIKRLDHISVVVDDLAAAIAFFTALGMTLEGKASVEGPSVDRLNGLEDVQADIAMMRTPDGHGRLELTKFRNPELVEI